MSILHAADNPTTSLGHPHSYSKNFLRNINAIPTTVTNGSTFLLSEFIDDHWFLDNNLILAESTYIDKLLGIENFVDDDVAKLLNSNDSSSSSLQPESIFFNGRSHHQLRHLCRQVLTQKIPEIGVRYWDAVIFVVNLLFFLFLLVNVGCIWRRKLKQSVASTLLREFFVLVFLITLFNMGHAIGSITLSLTNQIGTFIDQIIWFSLKFCMFITEICILFFGLCFSHSSSIPGACFGLFIAVFFAIIHLAFQSVFDFRLWDEYVNLDFFRSYGYAELNFWSLTSTLIGIIYMLIGFIPLVRCRHEPCILHRCSFFIYCLLMAILNFAQALAAVLIRLDCPDGLCIADVVTLAYFTLFAPVVYFLFLRGLTRAKCGGGLFSYRTHKNDPSSETNGYYPRFSGLISPSYDDLFDYDRIIQQQQDNTCMENILHLNYDFYHTASTEDAHNIPLMMTRTPDSTLTTHMDSDPSGPEPDLSTTSESRPIIRAPYASGSTFGNQQQHYKPKNLQVRSDGRLTFSTSSQINE